MANKDIPTLPGAHSLDGSESFHGNQGADSREITAAQIASYVQGLQQETKVNRTADQAIADALENDVLWTVDAQDDGNWHDTGSNTDRVTTGAGIFDAVAKIRLIGLATNGPTFEIRIGRYNSSDVLQEYVGEYASSNEAAQDPDILITALNIRMSAGDFLRVTVQSSDTAYSVESDDSYFMVRTAGLVPGKTGFVGARAYSDTALTAITSTPELHPMEQESYDTDGMHDLSTNNSRLTVNTAGKYLCFAQWTVGGVADSQDLVQIEIRKNGAAIAAHAVLFEEDAATTFPPSVAVSSGPVEMVIGDYFELWVRLRPTNDSDPGEFKTWISAMKVDSINAASNGGVFSGAKVNHTTNQSITSTNAVVDMANVVYDTDAYHVTGANDSRLTAPVAGYYRVLAQGAANVVDNFVFWSIEILRNGTTVIAENQVTTAATANTLLKQQVDSGVQWLNAGDYVELRLAWSPTVVAANGEHETFIQMSLVGRAHAGVGADLLEDLSDVDLATQAPAAGDLLEYDGTGWLASNRGKMVVVTRSTDFAPTDATNTRIEWNQHPIIDHVDFHSTSVENSRIEAPWTGRYRLTVSLQSVETTQEERFQIWMGLNRAYSGTPPIGFNNDFTLAYIEDTKDTTSGAVGTTLHRAAVIELTAGDYIQIGAWMDGAVAPALELESTFVSMEYLGLR